MFKAFWDFFGQCYDHIFKPIFSAELDGVSLFQWAFYGFLASLLMRYVIPWLLGGVTATVSVDVRDAPSGNPAYKGDDGHRSLSSGRLLGPGKSSGGRRR